MCALIGFSVFFDAVTYIGSELVPQDPAAGPMQCTTNPAAALVNKPGPGISVARLDANMFILMGAY